MSRHRIIRSMNYDDERYIDDGDDYGHSYDDKFSVSPSTAEQFMYKRDQSSNLSSCMNDELPDELSMGEELYGFHIDGMRESAVSSSSTSVDADRLQWCRDELQDVMGDAVEESILTETIVRHNYKLDLILNELLNDGEEMKPPRTKNLKMDPKQGERQSSMNSCSSYICSRGVLSDRLDCKAAGSGSNGSAVGVSDVVSSSPAGVKYGTLFDPLRHDFEAEFHRLPAVGARMESRSSMDNLPVKAVPTTSASWNQCNVGVTSIRSSDPDDLSAGSGVGMVRILDSSLGDLDLSCKPTNSRLSDAVSLFPGSHDEFSDFHGPCRGSEFHLSMSCLTDDQPLLRGCEITFDSVDDQINPQRLSCLSELIKQHKMKNDFNDFIHSPAQNVSSGSEHRDKLLPACKSTLVLHTVHNTQPISISRSDSSLSSIACQKRRQATSVAFPGMSDDSFSGDKLHPCDSEHVHDLESSPPHSVEASFSKQPSSFGRSVCLRVDSRVALTSPDPVRTVPFAGFSFRHQTKGVCAAGAVPQGAVTRFDFSTISPDDIAEEKRGRRAGRRPHDGLEQQRRWGAVLKAPHRRIMSPCRISASATAEMEELSPNTRHQPMTPDRRNVPPAGDSPASVTMATSSRTVDSGSCLVSGQAKSVDRDEDGGATGLHSGMTRLTLSTGADFGQHCQSSSLCGSRGNACSDPSPLPRSTSKTKNDKIDARAEYMRIHGEKEPINLVVIGHVDAGKSTLMGHLLYRLGNVQQRIMHKFEQESRKMGKSSFAYAWILDETEEERSRGVTVDIGQTHFVTAKKMVTLLDAPGHKDFIPNMITGVSQIIVVVNKMDTVDWAESRYVEIVHMLRKFLRQVGFKDDDLSFIPCSGLAGENLTASPGDRDLVSWYSGPTLLTQIDLFRSIERPVDKLFRLVVSDVLKVSSAGACVAGRLSSGHVRPGDKLLVMPAAVRVAVKSLTLDDEPSQLAFAGDNVTLSLIGSGVDTSSINAGSILCPLSAPGRCADRVHAKIVLFDLPVPMTKGFPVSFHYLCMSEPAVVTRLLATVNRSTGQVVKTRPKCLTKNSSATVEIRFERSLCLELFSKFRDLGRFMLRDRGRTIAAGVIEEILD